MPLYSLLGHCDLSAALRTSATVHASVGLVLRRRRWLPALLFAAAAAFESGCAAKRIELPTGAGAPFPEAASAFEAATRECRGVRTLQLTLNLSGKVGATRLRGSVDGGFEAPDRIRLEGRHPLGRPVFILVAAGPDATLLMPRDERVLRGVAPADIVEALVGLPLSPGDLRLLVSGCGFAGEGASEGRQYPGGLVAVDAGEATTYLRQEQGQWRIVAAVRAPLRVLYSEFAGARAQTVRLQRTGPPSADLTVRLEDVNINVPFEASVFSVDVPPGTRPLSLEELRRSGPLGGE